MGFGFVDGNDGIIPAYAGSTSAPKPARRACPDHPRIRGEHLSGAAVVAGGVGSSPHTRGARRTRPGRGGGTRIIPAYAGSTPIIHSTNRVDRDHPRIRGEHNTENNRPQPRSGSSPHTRGAPPDGKGKHAHRRIIPAYAGSTACRRFVCRGGRDHPRIRGEHLELGGGVVVSGGSSPHTRGALAAACVSAWGRRIIPAYAGSTHTTPTRHARQRDHPRIRGEHDFQVVLLWADKGSSPHTRGAHVVGAGRAAASGIIPAYAGSTGVSGGRRALSGDHPRIRGEHGTLRLL